MDLMMVSVKLIASLLLYGQGIFPLSSQFLPVSTSTIPTYTYEVVHAYPHDINAFTEGLFYKDGFIFESSGLLGRSSVRQVQLETGQIIRSVDLPPGMFGEGITHWKDKLIGVTWKSQFGFMLNLQSFSLAGHFSYIGEGWGLTHNNRELIMSDGTSVLRFLDPLTLREVRRLQVTASGSPVSQLNELEWADGEIFSNVWETDRIARINPLTGQVTGWIDLSGILPEGDRIPDYTDVLNGIAYDSSAKRLFVTGKLWPKMFEIRLVKQQKSGSQ